jgi:type VI secretion system secreted protein Hcp
MPEPQRNRPFPRILLLLSTVLVILTLQASCDGAKLTAPAEEPEEAPPGEEVAEAPTDEGPEPSASERLPGAKSFKEPEAPGALLGSPGFDMFLKITGVPGESTDDAHTGWIEILSYSHGISQPGSGLVSSGGARSVERSQHEDFSITKQLDKASPKLSLSACNGTHIEEVTLELCRVGEDRQTFMVYTLTDVIVASIRPSGTGAGAEMLPIEEVTFSYREIQWTYTEVDPRTGKAKGDVETHWDLEANKGG